MATSVLSGKAFLPSVQLPPAKASIQDRTPVKCLGSTVAGLSLKSSHSIKKGPVLKSNSARYKSFVCAAALSARCASEQTQTVQRQQTNITVAPLDSKEKSPDLDDGGAGFPPRDDDDGGGGGGGGGGWKGGFFFFGFLAFLGFLKDNEGEQKGAYSRKGRRKLSKI